MSDLIPPSPSATDYARQGSEPEDELFVREEPFGLFAEWFAEAKLTEPNDPNAMTLATVDAEGLPDARQVLLKDFSHRGFTFFTNLDSAKGRQLAANPRAALLFHWKSLRRQVRIRGAVSPATAEEADAYFATRARVSQIGAWASDQSRPLESRQELKRRVAEIGLRFAEAEMTRPPHWSGFRLVPLQIEFWRDRAFRLHERVLFERASPAAPWTRGRLYP
jgi:pyridoxamine 5'-phosphate oxidase